MVLFLPSKWFRAVSGSQSCPGGPPTPHVFCLPNQTRLILIYSSAHSPM